MDETTKFFRFMKRLFLIALMFAIPSCAFSQTSEGTPFNGSVTGADGAGLRVRISVKGSDKYTFSNKSGRFGLTDVNPDDTLVLKYKRHETEVPVAGRGSMKIKIFDGMKIGEVSAAPEYEDEGFGFVKRREYVSSGKLSGDYLRRSGYTSLSSAVKVCVPGVIVENDGRVAIRGLGSVNSGIYALILFDNSEVKSLDEINIFDVESVEVIRDGTLYGFRGANGVIKVRSRSK